MSTTSTTTKQLNVGVSIATNRGPATIVRIGPVHPNARTKIGWAMLTLDLDGAPAYAVAREDEIADSVAGARE